MTKNINILILVFFLSACQTKPTQIWTSSDIFINSETLSVYPKTISSKEVKQDVDYLMFLLSEGYSGKDYAPEGTYSNSIKALRDITGDLEVEKFNELVDDALSLIPDNHLYAFYRGRSGPKRSALDRKGNVGENRIKNRKKVWEINLEKVGKKNILYISLTRFPNPNDQLLNGFMKSVTSQLKTSDSIVLDMRGNTGGDDRVGMDLTTLLFGHPYEHPIKQQISFQTPVALALQINENKVDEFYYIREKLKVPEYLIETLSQLEKSYQLAIDGKLAPRFIKTGKGGGDRSDPVTGYKKPIYILMDASCGSSCEYVIVGFQWHNYVKKVGENTIGTFHFSNTGFAVLPNSRIRVDIPSQFSEFYDKRFIERIGLTPDVKVPAGEDAYEAVKKLINNAPPDKR